ncbi:hypothetical protein BCR34DRAFT_87357 [Clohesyomyces aquaticus]|uniref:Uncharacterized protein n=1 Tax=Clohesyomyces aquaticus TaxID=1231657 RepID=A0A1Y2A2S0_9PLEO|nr:hypothetical protein BCR34DRAFT_87357 [Clohesyomyces aquaticus]
MQQAQQIQQLLQAQVQHQSDFYAHNTIPSNMANQHYFNTSMQTFGPSWTMGQSKTIGCSGIPLSKAIQANKQIGQMRKIVPFQVPSFGFQPTAHQGQQGLQTPHTPHYNMHQARQFQRFQQSPQAHQMHQILQSPQNQHGQRGFFGGTHQDPVSPHAELHVSPGIMHHQAAVQAQHSPPSVASPQIPTVPDLQFYHAKPADNANIHVDQPRKEQAALIQLYRSVGWTFDPVTGQYHPPR